MSYFKARPTMIKKIKSLFRQSVGLLCVSSLLLSTPLFVACSENDDTIEEFPDWQARNDSYWNNLYTTTQQRINNGDTSWKIIRNYSLQNQRNDENKEITYSPENHIIVHVEKSGTGTTSPLFSDSVSVHYRGHMIPSTTYTSGLIFDQSWASTVFNDLTARPSHFVVQGLVDGFATALQAMHVGDHWTVYIPYQLGYGSQSQGQVQAYSTLIFDLRLVDFARPGVRLRR